MATLADAAIGRRARTALSTVNDRAASGQETNGAGQIAAAIAVVGTTQRADCAHIASQ